MQLKSNSNKTIGKFALFSCCLIIACFSVFISQENMAIISIIPILYSLLYLSPIGIIRYFEFNPGFSMVFIVSFMRYFLYPVLLSTFGRLQVQYTREFYSNMYISAIILYVYEMVAVYLTITLYKNRHHNEYTDFTNNSEDKLVVNTEINAFAFLFLLVAGAAIIISPSVLNNFNFIFSSRELRNILYNEESNSIVHIIVYNAKNILAIFLIQITYSKYTKTQSKLSAFMVVLAAFLPLLFVNGTNRGSVIVPAVTAVFVLSKIFPQYRKRIVTVCGSFVMLMLVVLTIRKVGNHLTLLSFNEIGKWLTGYIESYYAGIDNYSVSFAIKQDLPLISLSMLFKDIIYYIPGVGSKIINSSELSSRIYNHYLYGYVGRGDAAIPTTGQGLLYFGVFFSIIPIIVLVILALKCDDRIEKEKRLWMIYMLTIAGVYLGNNHACNISILAQQFIQVLAPTYLCYKFGNRTTITFGNSRSLN